MDRQNSNNKTLIIAIATVVSVLIIAITAIIAVKILRQPTSTNRANDVEIASTPTPTVDPNAETYQKAVSLFDQKNYKDAATLFAQLGDYEDAISKIRAFPFLILTKQNNKASRPSV